MFFNATVLSLVQKTMKFNSEISLPVKDLFASSMLIPGLFLFKRQKAKKNEELEKRFKTLFKRSGPFNTGNSQKLLSLVTTILLLEGIENSLAKFS